MIKGASEWSPFHDKNGVPICAGDLIKSYHFTGQRRKKHYLYHVAVPRDGHWEMVPVHHLVPSEVKGGGRCWMNQPLVASAEVIAGYGPGHFLDYGDRPKVSKEVP